MNTDREPIVVHECPVNVWFELSRAQFLTVPRLVMESMPFEWREKMAALLTEMDETFDWRPHEGIYLVKIKGHAGTLRNPPEEICDYRHGSVEHLRRYPRFFKHTVPVTSDAMFIRFDGPDRDAVVVTTAGIERPPNATPWPVEFCEQMVLIDAAAEISRADADAMLRAREAT